MKLDTNGNRIKWFGYKLHKATDAASELPLSILVTSENKYDNEAAVDFLDKFNKDYSPIENPKNVIMDAGYDSKKTLTI